MAAARELLEGGVVGRAYGFDDRSHLGLRELGEYFHDRGFELIAARFMTRVFEPGVNRVVFKPVDRQALMRLLRVTQGSLSANAAATRALTPGARSRWSTAAANRAAPRSTSASQACT